MTECVTGTVEKAREKQHTDTTLLDEGPGHRGPPSVLPVCDGGSLEELDESTLP